MLMATTTFSYLRASPVLCSASAQSNHPKQDSTRNNWWTPLFGWSSDPDYITHQGSNSGTPMKSEPVQSPTTRSRFGLGCFTEEKAKELRKKTMENSTFHDIMYHSAIASRLASDASSGRRQDR